MKVGQGRRPREAQQLDQIPQLMRGITAGLLMLGKTRAVEITEGIDRALEQYLRTDGVTLAPEAVDRLADAIVAVEYYMETIQSGRTGAEPSPVSASVAHLKVKGTEMVASLATRRSPMESVTRAFRSGRSAGQI